MQDDKLRPAQDGAAGSRPPATYLLLLLLVFQGFSGLAGGYGLVTDPTGSRVGLDPDWLQGSLFSDYFVPGLTLFVVLGLGPLVAAYGVLRRRSWARFATLMVGAALLIWIAVEILVVGYVSRPPLQLIYAVVGVAILLAALQPLFHRHPGANP